MALIFQFILLVIIIVVISSVFSQTPEEKTRQDQIRKVRLAVLLKKKRKYGRLSNSEYQEYKHLINIGIT